ncbi:hypothetical protein DBR32_01495 [Taibaiella sp. KBW10]|uniref:GldM family protein n=1 Tax=Taibaiella sp. KBW10 TaxID=2153357 RepID=UPI000F598B1C|nr:GldM family protein [Taibaiella sp. KBW10]RQO32312.1 hypothetical protein DBR32_01495 [Taibaiella sp. KBW10]
MLKYVLSVLILVTFATAVFAQDFKVTCPKNYVVATTENLIQVRVDNVACGNIQVRSDNGKLKKIGECTYILIPLRIGECNISVSRMMGNELVEIGVKTFKSVSEKSGGNHQNGATASRKKEVEVPVVKPKILFADKNGGDLRKMLVLRQNSLVLEKTEGVAAGKVKLVSFQVMVLDKEESIFTRKINGTVFDEDVMAALKQLRQGQMLLFTDIKCSFEGKIISLNDLIFDIKN